MVCAVALRASPRIIFMEKTSVRLITSDKVKIAADYYPAEGARGVVLLHMMPADRTSWTRFAEKLQQAGFFALAIDLRGHGESAGGPEGYKDFSDIEHQQSRLDVEAATDFLRAKGVEKLCLVGASIGANLALQYAAEHKDASAVVVLSPGLDYRGIATEALARQLTPKQAIYLAASADDKDAAGVSSTAAIHSLFNVCSCQREIKTFETGGHGTTIFERHPEFMDEIVVWLQQLPAGS